MPFKSKAQAKFMASQHPDIFKKWMAENHQMISKLPAHVKTNKKK